MLRIASALPEAERRVTDAMQGARFDAGGWVRSTR
jgi:hypothetical protein